MAKTVQKELFSHLSSRQAWLILISYVAFMIMLALLVQHFVDRESLQTWVEGTGAMGFLVFLVIEYLYIIFVPVYNTAIHLAAGYIFGGHVGWVLNFIATTAGLFTIIALVRRFGRPLLDRVVPPHIFERYDNFAQRLGPLSLFIVYVLPLFPDDEITYILAVGRVRIVRYILPILLGNTTKAAVSYIGDQGAAGFGIALGTRLIVLLVGLVLIGIQEYVYRKVTLKKNEDKRIL